MSLISTIILPVLEKELASVEPEIAQFIVARLKKLGEEVIKWAEGKLHVDINGDGKIGDA